MPEHLSALTQPRTIWTARLNWVALTHSNPETGTARNISSIARREAQNESDWSRVDQKQEESSERGDKKVSTLHREQESRLRGRLRGKREGPCRWPMGKRFSWDWNTC